MTAKPGPLLLTGAGVIFVWSGLRGVKVSSTLKDLIAGKAPNSQTTEPITDPFGSTSGITGSTAAGGYASASSVANDFLSYVGKVPYLWGGATPRGWDCSGAVNYVLSHDLGLAIPGYAGGTFNGSSHGPVTGQYLLWSGATTVPTASVQPGDLCCWLTHIGVAVDSQNYVSALDPQQGTGVGPIHGGGPTGEIVVIRRLNASISNSGSGGPPTGHRR